MKTNPAHIFQCLVVLAIFLGAGRAPAPPAAVVPDPSSQLALVPEAAKSGPPAWAHLGTRLVYFSASANISGASQSLVLDANGNWVNKNTGQKWNEQDVSGASGAGYSVFQIGYIDHDVVQLGCGLYVVDPTDGNVQVAGGSGMVTNAGCAADLWIHPDVLKNLKEVAQGPVLITRTPYTLNKKKYNAIRIQTTTANGYMGYVYDLDTGQMIFNGSSTQGAVGVGGATTLLTTGWLVEVKDVDVPWKAAAVPAWVGKFNELDYQGVISTVAMGGQLDRPMTIVTTPKARRDGWLRTSSTFTIQTFQGMPPDVSQSEGSSGPAVSGQWIGPDAIPKLKVRQIIDQNDITKTVTSVSDVNPRSVTISEVGQRHRVDMTYDAATGMLVAAQTITTLGPSQTTYRSQLVQQK